MITTATAFSGCYRDSSGSRESMKSRPCQCSCGSPAPSRNFRGSAGSTSLLPAWRRRQPWWEAEGHQHIRLLQLPLKCLCCCPTAVWILCVPSIPDILRFKGQLGANSPPSASAAFTLAPPHTHFLIKRHGALLFLCGFLRAPAFGAIPRWKRAERRGETATLILAASDPRMRL